MSAWYSKGLEGLLSRVIPEAAVFFVFGVSTAYEFDPNHEITGDITEDYVILPVQELASVTMTGGVLDAADVLWERVTPSFEVNEIQGVIIGLSWDSGAQTKLLAFIDSASAGLPQVLTGVNITARWSANGILKI